MFVIYKDVCLLYKNVKHWMCHYQMRHSSVQDERRSSRPSIVASHVTRVLSGRPITINEIMVEFGLNHEDWIFSICSVICQWCLPDLFPAFSHHSKKNIKSKHQHWCCTFAMLMKTFFFIDWLLRVKVQCISQPLRLNPKQTIEPFFFTTNKVGKDSTLCGEGHAD